MGFEVPPTLDLQETFLLRIPMLKSCSHFLRGRLRECFAVTLRERHRAKAVGGTVVEERGWKAFGLVPTMLLNRPRGWGSIGWDELSPAAKFVLFFPLWVSSRGILVVFGSAGAVKCVRLEFSGCRVKPRRPRDHQATVLSIDGIGAYATCFAAP